MADGKIMYRRDAEGKFHEVPPDGDAQAEVPVTVPPSPTIDDIDAGDGPWVTGAAPTIGLDDDGKRFGTFAPFVVGGEDDDPPPRTPIDSRSGRLLGEPEEVPISI